MTFSVQNFKRDLGDALYYSDQWQLVIESHLALLRSPSIASIAAVDPHDAFKYQGDFGGLMMAYNWPAQNQFIYLRTNGLYAPYEYPQEMTQVIIPSSEFIDRLRRTTLTISQKTNGV